MFMPLLMMGKLAPMAARIWWDIVSPVQGIPAVFLPGKAPTPPATQPKKASQEDGCD